MAKKAKGSDEPEVVYEWWVWSKMGKNPYTDRLQFAILGVIEATRSEVTYLAKCMFPHRAGKMKIERGRPV